MLSLLPTKDVIFRIKLCFWDYVYCWHVVNASNVPYISIICYDLSMPWTGYYFWKITDNGYTLIKDEWNSNDVFPANKYQKGKEVTVVFYFSMITRRFAITVIATTAKVCGPRQAGLCYYDHYTAANCEGLLYLQLYNVYTNVDFSLRVLAHK